MIKLLANRYKKKLIIDIHKDAKSAFYFSQNLHRQFDINKLDENHRELFRKNLTLHAIKSGDSEIEVFSGFENPYFDLTQTDFTDSNILIYPSDTSSEEIELRAWNNELLVLFSSVRSTSLGFMYEQINQTLPKYLMKKIFGKKHLSEQKLAYLSSVARTTISKQRKNMEIEKAIITSQDSPSIFFRIIE